MKRQLVFNKYQFIQNSSDDSVDIYIDGDIVNEPTREMYQAFWGDECSVSFKSIRDQITSSSARTFNIYINSGGGMVSDAFAIHDYMVELQSKGIIVNTIGIGIIASAATYILMSSKNSRITKNSWFMIHNMSGAIWGDVNEIENYAKMMRKFNDAAVDMYATATGKDSAEVTMWMNEETWFTGKEAAENGFVKTCSGSDSRITNSISQDKWPFNNMAILNKINNSIPQPKNKGMKKNKIANAIAEAFTKLGLNNDAKLSTIKIDELKEALVNSFENVEDDEDIETLVTNALAGDKFDTAVANAVKKVLEVIPANITEAISNSTKDLVNKTTLEEVKNDLADKLGTPHIRNTKKRKTEDEDEEESVNVTSDATNGRRIVTFD